MELVLAKPRGFCAGVVRAIEIVESALAAFGEPVYVVHEIVHNARVVGDLRARGAVFVDAVGEVPDGATAVFSAHGVPQSVMREAERRQLRIVDATCPLVTKVHLEVGRNAREGREVILIGHAGHPEVTGTLGRYDGSAAGGAIYLVETIADVDRLKVRDPSRLSYVTQTTLSIDDAGRIVAVLKRRYPQITGPRRDDICYATQNRQGAVHGLAAEVDLLLVVGARNSSNSNRLREVGEQMGVPSYLLQSAEDLRPEWLSGATRIGLTAGASTPEVLVQGVVDRLREQGVTLVREMAAEPETVTFRIPKPLATVRHDGGRPLAAGGIQHQGGS